MASRIAYFKSVSQATVDADQAAALVSLQGQLDTVNTSLALKAAASAVYTKSEVDSSLSAKADASAVYSKSQVDQSLAGKAAVADLAAKADASALATVESTVALKASTNYVDSGLAGKASSTTVSQLQSDVTARVAAESAFFTAFKEAILLSGADGTGEFNYSTLLPVS